MLKLEHSVGLANNTHVIGLRLQWYMAYGINPTSAFWVKQEAQLLLGDRATRKHAKDCWNGRGNDNLGWNDLQMYFKVIKSGTNRKLVYDFSLAVYSNFCGITHRIVEKFDVKQSNDLEISPRSSTLDRITSRLSCGHVCKMFGRQWTDEAKIAILNDLTLIWRPLSNEPPRISA